MNKNNIGLDLICNPRKVKSTLNTIKSPNTDSPEFIMAKKDLISQINSLSEKDLLNTPMGEINTTIHILFHYMLYGSHIKTAYNEIKDKK